MNKSKIVSGLVSCLFFMTVLTALVTPVAAEDKPDLTIENLDCWEEDGDTFLSADIYNRGSADVENGFTIYIAFWSSNIFGPWAGGYHDNWWPENTFPLGEDQHISIEGSADGTDFDCCELQVDTDGEIAEEDEGNNDKSLNEIDIYLGGGGWYNGEIGILNPTMGWITFDQTIQYNPSQSGWSVSIDPSVDVMGNTKETVSYTVYAPQNPTIYPIITIFAEDTTSPAGMKYNGSWVINTHAPNHLTDVKPDTIQVNSHGEYVTVFFQIDKKYDITTANQDSIYLRPSNTRHAKNIFPAEDVPIQFINIDGRETMVVKFDRDEIIQYLPPGESTTMVFHADLEDGTPFMGLDTVRIIR